VLFSEDGIGCAQVMERWTYDRARNGGSNDRCKFFSRDCGRAELTENDGCCCPVRMSRLLFTSTQIPVHQRKYDRDGTTVTTNTFVPSEGPELQIKSAIFERSTASLRFQTQQRVISAVDTKHQHAVEPLKPRVPIKSSHRSPILDTTA
jgi:hypothetical protein